jgi:hypothetical protein
MSTETTRTTDTQKQRSELSWRRTVLSALGVGALFTRFVLISGWAAFVVVAIVLSVLVVLLAYHRVRSIDRPIRRTLPAIALVVAVYAVTSAVLVLHTA